MRGRLWVSEFIHEVCNIVIFSIKSSKFFFVQRCQFPIVVGHGDAFEFAGLDALAAVGAFVYVVAGDVAFCGAVENDDLQRVGGTVFGTEIAACAFGGFKM